MQKSASDTYTVKRGATVIFTLASLLVIFFSLFYAEELKEGVRLGIKIAASSVIPSIFPFFIFSDFLESGASFKKSGWISRSFERGFKINATAIGAFICGLICGFPTGVKYATRLYRSGRISRDECERLICFVNNPSLAFCVSGVGIAMRGSLKDGLILYLSVVASAIFIGISFSFNKQKSTYAEYNIEQKFNLSSSIKDAGFSSLAVSSYIIFFSCILELTKAFAKNGALFSLIAALTEVGNAVFYIAKECNYTAAFSIFITGFALGFSGISVHMQAFSLLPSEIDKRKYIVAKFLQGLFCGVFSFLLYSADAYIGVFYQ